MASVSSLTQTPEITLLSQTKKKSKSGRCHGAVVVRQSGESLADVTVVRRINGIQPLIT